MARREERVFLLPPGEGARRADEGRYAASWSVQLGKRVPHSTATAGGLSRRERRSAMASIMRSRRAAGCAFQLLPHRRKNLRHRQFFHALVGAQRADPLLTRPARQSLLYVDREGKIILSPLWVCRPEERHHRHVE